MTTLADISRRAGVSVATVSRVLNSNPQVAGESVALVQTAAQELGYRLPPQHARHRGHTRATPRAVSRGKKQVALLFPDNQAVAMKTALSGRLMRSITQELAGQEFSLVPTLLQPDGQLPAILRSSDVAGVIVRGTINVAPHEPLLRRLPCVWLLSLANLPAQGDQVADNPSAAGQLAADYFLSRGLSRGLRRLAVLNHEPSHPCYGPRAQAFIRHVASAAGVTVDRYEGAPVPELISRMLASPLRPDGLFLPVPDVQLLQADRTLAAHGIRPGIDIDFLGCSYDPSALAAMNPSLPNIDIHPEHIGRAAVEMLFWRLKNPTQPRRRLFLTPSLILPGVTPPYSDELPQNAATP